VNGPYEVAARMSDEIFSLMSHASADSCAMQHIASAKDAEMFDFDDFLVFPTEIYTPEDNSQQFSINVPPVHDSLDLIAENSTNSSLSYSSSVNTNIAPLFQCSSGIQDTSAVTSVTMLPSSGPDPTFSSLQQIQNSAYISGYLAGLGASTMPGQTTQPEMQLGTGILNTGEVFRSTSDVEMTSEQPWNFHPTDSLLYIPDCNPSLSRLGSKTVLSYPELPSANAAYTSASAFNIRSQPDIARITEKSNDEGSSPQSTIRFVHAFASTGAGGRTILRNMGPEGRHTVNGHALVKKRRKNRKTGVACSLCSEQKIKVPGDTCGTTGFRLIIYSAILPNLNSHATLV
jgi:hypothetical protein